MDFSKEELAILGVGLGMYRKKLLKILKESEALKTGEKEIKQTFLKAEKLADKIALK